ncbi:MAG: diacylglycerol kinase family lipid kinase, partial [Firmicutes bacterium]|nr:diacylglycerol kinase family lipid kinase [Bacillota bacterium]
KDKKVLLIVNPVSGTLRSHSALFEIVDRFCGAEWQVTTAITQYRGHASILASQAADKGFDMIVCCGGDGTLNETVTGMMCSEGKTIPLGYVPAGSTNDFAATLGLSSDPKEAASHIVTGRPLPLDIGKFGNTRYFSYIASFGAFTAASYSAPQELKNIVGHLAYLLEGVRDLSSLKPCHTVVEVNGTTLEDDYVFGSVTNTRSVGGIVQLKESDVRLDDGLFEVILVKMPKSPIDVNNIITGLLYSDFSASVFEAFKAQSVSFRFDKPVNWSLDGEKIEGGDHVLIENMSKAISLLIAKDRSPQ